MHTHAQKLFFGVAVEFLHGLVDGQNAQAFVLHIHPDGLGMCIKQVSVLLLRRPKLRGHLAQLHHGTQRFRKNLQVRQVALVEDTAALRQGLERSHHLAIHAQRHSQCCTHPRALVGAAHFPALGCEVVAQHRLARLQVGPQQAVLQRQCRSNGTHHLARRSPRHQGIAFQHFHQSATGATGFLRGLRHQHQHFGQGHVQG